MPLELPVTTATLWSDEEEGTILLFCLSYYTNHYLSKVVILRLVSCLLSQSALSPSRVRNDSRHKLLIVIISSILFLPSSSIVLLSVSLLSKCYKIWVVTLNTRIKSILNAS